MQTSNMFYCNLYFKRAGTIKAFVCRGPSGSIPVPGEALGTTGSQVTEGQRTTWLPLLVVLGATHRGGGRMGGRRRLASSGSAGWGPPTEMPGPPSNRTSVGLVQWTGAIAGSRGRDSVPQACGPVSALCHGRLPPQRAVPGGRKARAGVVLETQPYTPSHTPSDHCGPGTGCRTRAFSRER